MLSVWDITIVDRWSRNNKIEEMLGEIITKIEQNKEEELHFYTDKGDLFIMYHDQDCCESVYLEDVIGDLDDLIDSPISMAEEVINAPCKGEEGYSEWDSSTWTFYKLVTNKGYVTLRWYGTSNGYYSESVDFVRITKEDLYFHENRDEFETQQKIKELKKRQGRLIADLIARHRRLGIELDDFLIKVGLSMKDFEDLIGFKREFTKQEMDKIEIGLFTN